MTWKCSQTLWDYEFFTEKIANFKERKLRIYINFNLKNQIYFFSLVRRLYWSDVCTGPTFVLVRRLYWSDVCTGPTFVLVRRMYCPTFVSLRFVPSDVCGSYVCTSTVDSTPKGRLVVEWSLEEEAEVLLSSSTLISPPCICNVAVTIPFFNTFIFKNH